MTMASNGNSFSSMQTVSMPGFARLVRSRSNHKPLLRVYSTTFLTVLFSRELGLCCKIFNHCTEHPVHCSIFIQHDRCRVSRVFVVVVVIGNS